MFSISPLSIPCFGAPEMILLFHSDFVYSIYIVHTRDEGSPRRAKNTWFCFCSSVDGEDAHANNLDLEAARTASHAIPLATPTHEHASQVRRTPERTASAQCKRAERTCDHLGCRRILQSGEAAIAVHLPAKGKVARAASDAAPPQMSSGQYTLVAKPLTTQARF